MDSKSIIINEIWLSLNTIKDKLFYYGIFLENNIHNNYFIINFDIKKINKESIAFKKNINGILIICRYDLNLEFVLLYPNKIINIISIIDSSHKINSNFPVVYILKKIFKILNIKFLKNEEINSNLLPLENYELFEKILRSFEIMLNINIELLIDLQIKLNNDKKKIEHDINLSYFKNINILNFLLYEKFIIKIIHFEKFFFPEIFELTKEKQMTLIKQKNIQHIKDIENKFLSCEKYKLFEQFF